MTKKRAAEEAAPPPPPAAASPSSSSPRRHAHHPAAESLLQLKGEREREPAQGTISVPVSLLASLEARIRKLEGSGSGPPSPSTSVGTEHHHHHHHNAQHAQQPTTLGSPRYDVGSAARPVYHGEISMFDEGAEREERGGWGRSPSPEVVRERGHRASGVEQEWSDESLRAAARLRHRYASPEDGENWVESYFCWASAVDGVVHRPSFIRECAQLRYVLTHAGDMALDGPYFSDFLLVAIYVTGIRFITGMDEREREARGAHYEGIAMSMLPEQIMNPGSIASIRGLITPWLG